MQSNVERKYRSSRRSDRDGDWPLIPRAALWTAMAHDDDAFNAEKQKSSEYLLVGVNDIRYVEGDLEKLSVSEKVKMPDLNAIKAIGAGRSRMSLEDRLYRVLPDFLVRMPEGVRQAEQFQVVSEMATRHGYLDGQGHPTSRLLAWQANSDASAEQVHDLLVSICCRYRSEEFRQSLDRREGIVCRHLEEQWALAYSLLATHGYIHAMVIDLGVYKTPIPFSVMAAGLQHDGRRLLDGAHRLVGYMQSEISVREKCLGAIFHVDRHQDLGFYLRVIFLVVPEGLGFRKQFESRVKRLWQGVVGGGGWVQDRRGHPNKFIGSLGMVSVKDEGSISRLKKALMYGGQKDLYMRVYVGDGATFLTAAIRPSHYGSALGSLPAYRI